MAKKKKKIHTNVYIITDIPYEYYMCLFNVYLGFRNN